MLFAFGGRVKGVRRSNSCQRVPGCALANRKISRLCDQLSGHRSIRFYHAPRDELCCLSLRHCGDLSGRQGHRATHITFEIWRPRSIGDNI